VSARWPSTRRSSPRQKLVDDYEYYRGTLEDFRVMHAHRPPEDD